MIKEEFLRAPWKYFDLNDNGNTTYCNLQNATEVLRRTLIALTPMLGKKRSKSII